MPVLKVLHACGAVRHTRLAELLQLDTSTVSRKVRHLEELGLVQIVADREDGRARQVELLPAGRGALEQLLAVRRAAIRQVLAHWPARDREQLRVLLDRLVTDLEAAPGPA
jgi:DNA-binding MarR family transcriptional regulator